MSDRIRILVVDDNRSAADAMARVLRQSGDEVATAYDGNTAIDEIKRSPPDLVLTDLRMEPVDGMAVLRAARALRPPVDCIVFTAYGEVDVAVQAMRLGARDFLTKPVSVEQVNARVAPLRRTHRPASVAADAFVAHAASSQRLFNELERAAKVPARVWIEGEIGSGRVFCARTLHALSGSPDPLAVLDPGRSPAWPTSGTVVLPNVDQLPDDLQRQLVRSLALLPPEVRVIATSSGDGRRLVTQGVIRPELYFALGVIVVRVPPLRERVQDIGPLFERALEEFASTYHRPRPSLADGQMAELTAQPWPGNVRELRNAAERLVVMGPPPATESVPTAPPATIDASLDLEHGFNLSDYLEGVERRILEEALKRCGGDRTAVGRLLGVERNTLRYKLNKYGLLDR